MKPRFAVLGLAILLFADAASAQQQAAGRKVDTALQVLMPEHMAVVFPP